jgi:hypothetical protein
MIPVGFAWSHAMRARLEAVVIHSVPDLADPPNIIDSKN